MTPSAPAPPAWPRWLLLSGQENSKGSPGWAAAMTAAALLFLWPRIVLVPAAGLDPSYGAALATASQRGLHFGHQIVFTFGPLGFLRAPTLYFGLTALLAELFVICMEAGLLFVVARNLLRAFGRIVGCLAFVVVAALAVFSLLGSFPAEVGAMAVAILAIDWVQASRPRERLVSSDAIVPGALGAVSGMLLLVKFDAGMLGLAVLSVACLLRQFPDGGAETLADRARSFLATAGSAIAGAVASVFAFWLAASQRLGDLPGFFRGSLQLVQGYSSAMSLESPDRHWEYAAAALILLVLVGLGTWAGIRTTNSFKRFALPVVMVVMAESLFKEGFVRHDGHSVIFFAGLVVMSCVLWRWLPRAVGLIGIVVAIPVLLAGHPDWAQPAIVRAGPHRAMQTMQYLLQSSKRHELQRESRTALRIAYAIPPAVVAQLSGHTVHIDPWEATVAWAYPEFVWDPVPVFQDYQAYSEPLDRLNADFLASKAAPEYILRAPTAIDGRDPAWESPSYVLEMMCRYRQIDVASGWQVLQRVPSRCGAEVTMSVTAASMGTPFNLPPPPEGSIETVRISWLEPASEKLRALAFKEVPYYANYAGQQYRFLPGTGGAQHVVSVPSCLGWSPTFAPTFAPTMAVAQGQVFATSSALNHLLGPVAPFRAIRVSVASVPIRCTA